MKRKLFLLFIVPFLLMSCSKSAPLVFDKYDTYMEVKKTKFNIDKEEYYQKENFEKVSYTNYWGQTSQISSFRELYNSTNDGKNYVNCLSTGTRKLLVLPINFSDSDKSELDKKKIIIENAFFGKEKMTTNESIASYYNKASYGNLIIDGEVAPFYDLNYSSSFLQSMITHKNIEVAIRFAVGMAIKSYCEANPSKINEFDSDKDGFIDSVYAIYNFPTSSKGSLFWAITEHMDPNVKISVPGEGVCTLNTTSPYINSYSWSSYYSMNEKNNICDTHIFIHETGHLLGLDDYYSDNQYQPTGYMDMMDYNIGDHSAYSKMLLNWTTPKVVKKASTIEIGDFENSGDCLLIPYSKYNDTPYDEYLLLEYYSPSNLNAYDSTLVFTYKDRNNVQQKGHLFKTYGIKLYHVDSRIGFLTNKANKGSVITIKGNSDEEEKLEAYRASHSTYYFPDFAFNNNNQNSPLYHLLDKTGTNEFIYNQPANENTLFKINDTFGYNTFNNFKFHNGEKPKFKFKVSDLNPNKATITFENF